MTSRHVFETTSFKDYTLTYDAENRLVSVTGNATANFVYDGDGKQIKATVNGITAVYVGNHYEVKNSIVTKYYFAGSTRLAVRTDGTLRFILGDHLGSSSVTTNASGAKTASALYKAFGETRFTAGTLSTDYKFTGQREESALGIYWFSSRWFDPTLGRFMSPDTIVPTSTQGTQAWDRYAFVNNNPVRYTDPTGHGLEGDGPPPSDDPCIKYGQSSPECQAATPPTSTPTPPATSTPTPVQSSTTTPTPTPITTQTPVQTPVSSYYSYLGSTWIFSSPYHIQGDININFDLSSTNPANLGANNLDVNLPFFSIQGDPSLKIDFGTLNFTLGSPANLYGKNELQGDGTYTMTSVVPNKLTTTPIIAVVPLKSPDSIFSVSIPGGSIGPLSWSSWSFSWP